MIMEPLCVVLHRNLKWRDSGERLLREMDSFDFIEAWDAAVKERQTVPSVTTQMLIADAVTAHLTLGRQTRCAQVGAENRAGALIRPHPRCAFQHASRQLRS